MAAAASSIAAEPEPVVKKLIATTYGGSNLHMVGSDGKIEAFKLPKGTVWGGGGPEGSADPVISPDGKLLAFIQSGSLIIRPLEGGKGSNVVSGYKYETLLITGWTPDSTRLVYFLGPPQADDAPPSKIKDPQHFVHDLKAKKSTRIKVQGELCGWLPGGRMLLYDGEHGTLSEMAPAPGAQVKVLNKEAAGFGQIDLSPDGTRIALSRSKPNDTSSGSQLVTMDVDGSKVEPLTKVGEWAELQWPRWSPSGKRHAWLKRTGMKDGRPFSVLVVDGKDVTQPDEVSYFVWLTESTLAVIELEALAVVNADTSKELGRKVLPKTAE